MSNAMPDPLRTCPNWLMLVFFLALTVGGGTLIGVNNIPGEWYTGLQKPSFNPPNWIFAPVWTLLYVAIAVAGWRTWRRDPRDGAMFLWVAQLVLNFSWSPVFFGAERPGTALAVIAALLVLILLFLVVSWRRDRTSALLFVPYGLWVAFGRSLMPRSIN
jgi:benzodiazapine receptor